MKKQDLTSVDSTQIRELIASLEQRSLSDQQMLLLERLLRLLLSLIDLLEHRRTSITRLKRIVFGPAGDKRSHSQSSTISSDPISADQPSETSKAESSDNDSPDSQEQESKAGGHGRNPASAYTAARIVSCTDPALEPGDRCPDNCCRGHLYDTREPAVFIRLEGQPLVGATRYDQQVLRCSACQTRYTAPLPEGVAPEKYSPTADAALALAHYGAGLPFHRIERQQELVGVPLPASVQFERCEQVADALLSVYLEMVKKAARAGLIYIDDTGVKILECEQEKKLAAANEKAPDKQRKTCTTGIVALLDEDEQLALYFSGNKHAGENLSQLLKGRPAKCGTPIQMADALSSNWKKGSQTIAAKCWAHARRQFIDIETKFPLECGRVLDTIAQLYKAEAETEGMTSA